MVNDRCNRYVFKYVSSPLEVKDYIQRLADLGEKTYGRDTYFARFNQILDNARILGWRIPRFGDAIPEPFQELSPEGIDHIFENQAKILIDISPISLVTLENGDQFPLRMLGGTTPAGDLNWKCHLLIDKKGQPYVQSGNLASPSRFLIKIRGTKVVCSAETQTYDESELRDYFGGNRGIWPVPFLPEFFSDHPIAQVFMAEGVTEVVKIEEDPPVHVLAVSRVPWYRILEIDHTKILPMSNFKPTFSDDSELVPELSQSSEEFAEEGLMVDDDQDDDDGDQQLEKELSEPNYIEVEPVVSEEPKISFTNVQVSLTDAESKKLASLEQILSSSQIKSKLEAEKLRQDASRQQEAEQWLLAAVNRLTLLANASSRIGAVLSLVEKNLSHPVVIIQPREKWCLKLQEVLQQRGIETRVLSSNKKLDVILRKLNSGKIQVLISPGFFPELPSVENCLVVSVSSFVPITWIEQLQVGQRVISISIKQLGLADHNYLVEHPFLTIDVQDYDGPALQLFKNSEIPIPKTVGTSKTKKGKNFKIETGGSRPLKASTLEEATEIAKKKEIEGCQCKVIDPTGEIVYLTNIGNVDDKAFKKEKINDTV